MDRFKYLIVRVNAAGGMGEEVVHKALKERKVKGTMGKLWKRNMVSREVKKKRELYERIVYEWWFMTLKLGN